MKQKPREKLSIRKTQVVLEEMENNRRSLHFQYNEGNNELCITLQDLSRKWLSKRYDMVKKSTFSNYRYHVNIYIHPAFGDLHLSELDRNSITTFIEGMEEKGLADSTIRSVLMTFKSIIRFGIQSNYLSSNLLEACYISCRRQESKVLTNQDSLKMKEYLMEQNTDFSLGILLCRGTGIRIGELCGLKWEDIDFTTNTFKIKRTVSRITNPDISSGKPKTILYIRTPKSYTSERVIPIPNYLINILKQMKKEGNKYLLTGSENCTEPRNVQKKFKTILKHCQMQDCNFHAMRHGFATSCLESGIDCKTVSSILGHASTRTTLDFYGHTSMRQMQNCINMIS